MMTDQKIKELIESTARATVEEMKRQMILGDFEKIAEKDASEMLKSYFHSENNEKLSRVLKKISHDPYYDVITMYYRDGEKIERIAEMMNCEVMTIYRNKKRLCKIIYQKML